MQAYYAGVNVGATAPTWVYDPFGNRTSETWTGNGSALVPTTSAVVFAAASNQTSTFNGTSYQHDAAGDVTYDGLNSYLYDAEGRLCAVKNQSGAMTGYVYDAGGIRVAKAALTSFSCNFASNGFPSTASWTGTSWVLGLGSEQVTEYSVSAGASTWQHTNVFASGALLASYNGTDTYFALNDWLGTKRVELNAINTCETGFRSLQFGDGYASFALSTSLPACVDATEQHFTGKERDTESGNDYFDARYYSNGMGRFMSPDWSSKEEPIPYAQLYNPQTLNLYAYVRNSPVVGVDPDGHCCWDWIKQHAISAGIGVLKGLGLMATYKVPPSVSFTQTIDFVHTPQDVASQQSQLPTIDTRFTPNGTTETVAAVATIAAVTLAPGGEEIEEAGVALKSGLSDGDLVVRGGIATPEQLTNGAESISANGTLQGVSVNSAPGASVADLSKGIRNNQVSVTTVGQIKSIGGDVTPTPSSNNANHCDMCNVNAQDASKIFTQQANPTKER